jgi:hypothetical protein
MSNVIEFLESLGANAALAGQSAERYIAAVEALELEEAERIALLNKDVLAISSALGGREKLFCFVAAEEDQPQEEGESEEAPDQQEPTPDADSD